MESSTRTYLSHSIRLSGIWKAEVRTSESTPDNLTLDQIMGIFTTELRRRNVQFKVPSDPLADTSWILLLQRIYVNPTDFAAKPLAIMTRSA